MKKTISKYYKKHEHFIKYGFIWLLSVSLDFLIYTFLIKYTDINYQMANFISTSCGIINSFLLNLFFNFKTKDKILKRFISFYTIGFLGIIVSAISLYLLIVAFWFEKIFSKAITLVFVVLIQYILNKNITFKT